MFKFGTYRIRILAFNVAGLKVKPGWPVTTAPTLVYLFAASTLVVLDLEDTEI